MYLTDEIPFLTTKPIRICVPWYAWQLNEMQYRTETTTNLTRASQFYVNISLSGGFLSLERCYAWWW